MGIEVLAVAITVGLIVFGTLRWLFRAATEVEAYESIATYWERPSID